MRKIRFALSYAALVLLGLSAGGCRSGREEAPQGNFMENEPYSESRTFPVRDLMKKRREEKELREAEFRDVSRPLKRDSFQVYPWKQDAAPRSEKLHDRSREGTNSIF